MTRATALAALTAALSCATPALAAEPQDQRPALLAVPYLTQTQQLCGGAALAMVLRYWGMTDVFAEDFAQLVDDEERGIRTSVLTEAARERGLDVVATAPDAAGALTWLRREIERGRPVITLIEVRPRTYHYVVIAGITDAAVVYHDPARAPFEVLDPTEFDRRWAPAGRWLLAAAPRATTTITQPTVTAGGDAPARIGSGGPSPCRALVDTSVQRAAAGDAAVAEAGLLAATRLCADTPDGWLELAGLRFVQRRYDDAAELAQKALELDSDHAHAWRILGTTDFLREQWSAALFAWNHVGEPTTDAVRAAGVTRTPHPLIVRTTGLQPRQLLTPDRFVRAERRLRELPVALRAAVRYEPRAGGVADVSAVVEERPAYPAGLIGWAVVGLNAAFQREIRATMAGLVSQGEAFDVGYRFRSHRPRVAGEFAFPAPGPLTGIIALESFWERQAYAAPAAVSPTSTREVRRRTAVRWSDWATSWLRLQIGGGLDRFDERRFGSVDGQVTARLARDHITLRFLAAHWRGSGGALSSMETVAAWRSHDRADGPRWNARAGISGVTAGAPLAMWPTASSSSARGVLLRGHDLFHSGIITTEIIGRRLAFGSIEYIAPVLRDEKGSLSVAAFADTAQASQRTVSPTSSGWQLDVGGGVRIGTPALPGLVRLDVGYATRTRQASVSAGYVLPWGW